MAQSFHDHFSAVAHSYAQFRPRYPQALFDHLAALAPRRELAWDCACGNGQASVPLAQRFEAVIGTDASAAQIAAAAAHPRIQYRVSTAEASALAAASVDLITVAQALHWFDLDAFYREANRVMRADALIAAWTYAGLQLDDPAIMRLIGVFYREELGPFWPPERKIVETGYRTLAFPFAEIAVPEFHISARWNLTQLLGYLRSWSAVNRYQLHHGIDPVTALARELAPLWGAEDTEREVRWPLAFRAGRKLARQ